MVYTVYLEGCVQSVHGVHSVSWKVCSIRTQYKLYILEDMYNPYTTYAMVYLGVYNPYTQ